MLILSKQIGYLNINNHTGQSANSEMGNFIYANYKYITPKNSLNYSILASFI